MSHDTLVDRLRSEFVEMPGLWLTREPTQCLCGVERAVCQSVLDALVHAKFLCVTSDGSYARDTDGATLARAHPAKASVRTGTWSLKVS